MFNLKNGSKSRYLIRRNSALRQYNFGGDTKDSFCPEYAATTDANVKYILMKEWALD